MYVLQTPHGAVEIEITVTQRIDGGNNSTGLLYRNLNSNSPKPNLGTSPNQYNRYNGITSPSSSPSQSNNNNNSSILNSTSPTGVNMSKHFNQRVPNNLNNLGDYFSFSKRYLFYLILI